MIIRILEMANNVRKSYNQGYHSPLPILNDHLTLTFPGKSNNLWVLLCAKPHKQYAQFKIDEALGYG